MPPMTVAELTEEVDARREEIETLIMAVSELRLEMRAVKGGHP